MASVWCDGMVRERVKGIYIYIYIYTNNYTYEYIILVHIKYTNVYTDRFRGGLGGAPSQRIQEQYPHRN